MSEHVVLEQPRLLREKAAIAYSGMAATKFKELVAAGVLHKVSIDGCVYVPRAEIDAMHAEAIRRGHLDTTEYAIERRGAK